MLTAEQLDELEQAYESAVSNPSQNNLLTGTDQRWDSYLEMLYEHGVALVHMARECRRMQDYVDNDPRCKPRAGYEVHDPHEPGNP